MNKRSVPWFAAVLLGAVAALAAACSDDPTPTPTPTATPTPQATPTPTLEPTAPPDGPPGGPPGPPDGPPPPAFEPADFPDLTPSELEYLFATRDAMDLFAVKSARFGELFGQAWPTPERLLESLYEAGAGTAFVDSLEALEALDPPDRFPDDYVIVLESTRQFVAIDARIGEAIKAGDAEGFVRLNGELAKAVSPNPLKLSRPACLVLSQGHGFICEPDDLPAGAYGVELNTLVRTMESKLGAATGAPPPGVLSPDEEMALAAEQIPTVVELTRTAVAELLALTPPEELRADHDRLTSYLGDAIGIVSNLSDAARSGDRAALGAGTGLLNEALCETRDAFVSRDFLRLVEAHFFGPSAECGPPPA